MNPLRFIKSRLKLRRMYRARADFLAALPADCPEIEPRHWADSLCDPTSFYLRCLHYFHRRLPEEVRRHRAYFSAEGRGFGEDAFHVMWFLLFRELRPASFLEIGVYRGQTVTLAALLARLHAAPCRVCAISPFSPAGDAVSRYRAQLDYLADTLANFDHFGLPHPELLKAFSTDEAARPFVAAASWDVVYIDGNHDYDIVCRDWALCAPQVRRGGVIVLDDASLGTAYRPPLFATAGHPGPSRFATEIPRDRFREVLQVGHNRVFERIA